MKLVWWWKVASSDTWLKHCSNTYHLLQLCLLFYAPVEWIFSRGPCCRSEHRGILFRLFKTIYCPQSFKGTVLFQPPFRGQHYFHRLFRVCSCLRLFKTYKGLYDTLLPESLLFMLIPVLSRPFFTTRIHLTTLLLEFRLKITFGPCISSFENGHR